MAILKVHRMGHPVLRLPAREIPPDQIQTDALQRLVDDMIATMQDDQGIGLAAPQVGQALRLVVLGQPGADESDPDAIPLIVLINPEWLDRSSEQDIDWEGCLSIPGLRGAVPRSTSVEVRALGREGEGFELRASDFLARVLQHEIDHLDGILFLDRMEDMRHLAYLEEFHRYWNSAD